MDPAKLFRDWHVLLALQPRDWKPTTSAGGLRTRSRKSPLLVEANKARAQGGSSYCEATEAFQISYEIPPVAAHSGTLPKHEQG